MLLFFLFRVWAVATLWGPDHFEAERVRMIHHPMDEIPPSRDQDEKQVGVWMQLGYCRRNQGPPHVCLLATLNGPSVGCHFHPALQTSPHSTTSVPFLTSPQPPMDSSPSTATSRSAFYAACSIHFCSHTLEKESFYFLEFTFQS